MSTMSKQSVGAMKKVAAVVAATVGFGGLALASSEASAQVMILRKPSLSMPKPGVRKTPPAPTSNKAPELRRAFVIHCAGPEKLPMGGLGTLAPESALNRQLVRPISAGAIGAFALIRPENIRSVSAPTFTKDASGNPQVCVTIEADVAK